MISTPTLPRSFSEAGTPNCTLVTRLHDFLLFPRRNRGARIHHAFGAQYLITLEMKCQSAGVILRAEFLEHLV